MRALIASSAAVVVLAAGGAHAPAAQAKAPPTHSLAERLAKSWCGSASGPLSPRALRGLEDRLPEYPTLSLATTAQRDAAKELLAASVAAAEQWDTLASAAAAGFDLRQAQRRSGDSSAHYLHAEHRPWGTDPRLLDPTQPKALIYANLPGRRIVLVGLMFSMPRGVLGPNPGGPITRWHRHRVCVQGAKRGLTPRADGTCAPGAHLSEGSEMLHIWFTGDLRSAFAIHAPEPELCAANLLPGGYCSRR
jgi:hypothetical protein